MNKTDFVSRQQALGLRNLGFDEPTLFAYRGGDLYTLFAGGYLDDAVLQTNSGLGPLSEPDPRWVSAPTLSQALRWIRKTHGISEVSDDESGSLDSLLRILSRR